jgi:hypothetical protein
VTAGEEEAAGEELFEGIRYSQLRIDSVDWEHTAEHIRTRSTRYGPKEFDVEPEWATEAALDPQRLVGSGTSTTSIQVVGLSQAAPGRAPEEVGRVLKVWLVPKDHPPTSGDWWGASACAGNKNDRQAYEKGG